MEIMGTQRTSAFWFWVCLFVLYILVWQIKWSGALKSSLEIWLWLNWWYPRRWSWVNPFHFCSLYRVWFCFSVSLQMTGFHFYPNSCPLRNIYLNFQGDYSSFYIWALEQQNRKPKVLVSNSSWASRSLAHYRCPKWILIWHARPFL